MTDRELLELAAKAAGLHFHGHRETKTITAAWVSKTGDTDDWFSWNPLTDDGDALRLLIQMRFDLCPLDGGGWEVSRWDSKYSAIEGLGSDIDPRRAIVRAAAEIGKAMP